jgi:hypothetical protein
LLDLFAREEKLVEHAKALKVTSGTEPDAELGPVISKQVHSRVRFLTYQVFHSRESNYKLLIYNNFDHEKCPIIYAIFERVCSFCCVYEKFTFFIYISN